MANMRMAKKSRSPIWSRGTMAFMIDFRTTWRPARRRGRRLQCCGRRVLYPCRRVAVEECYVNLNSSGWTRDWNHHYTVCYILYNIIIYSILYSIEVTKYNFRICQSLLKIMWKTAHISVFNGTHTVLQQTGICFCMNLRKLTWNSGHQLERTENTHCSECPQVKVCTHSGQNPVREYI